MEQKKLSELTDLELLREARKMKSIAVLNAVLIGLVIGVIFYGIVKNRIGFLTLILLFVAYKMINNSKHNKKELEHLLRERNLK